MKKFLYLFLVVAVVFAGCSKDKDNEFAVSGQVKNVSERVVKSGTVSLMSGSSVAYTTSLSSSGKYSLSNVKSGSYTLNVVAAGYETYSNAIEISGSLTKNIVITGGSTLSGRIIDSQTGSGLANAQIAFTTSATKSGGAIAVDTTLANADFVITTDEYGYYELDGMAYGIFVVVIRAEGFITRVITEVTITSGEFVMPDVTIVQPVAAGSLRIVLTWGETPYDLDSHLTGPASDGSRFHMYYTDKSPTYSDVNLDVDDTYSYGPETTTIESFHNGMYRYSIFNYSDQSSEGGSGIYTSPARVEVYDYTGLIRTYNAPVFTTGSGNTWRVFEFNVLGSSYTITDINEYLYASGSYYVEKSGFNGGKPAVSYRPDVF